MNRTPQQWQDFEPSRAINRLSRPALRVALEDARADILELVAALRHVRSVSEHLAVDALDCYIDEVLGE